MILNITNSLNVTEFDVPSKCVGYLIFIYLLLFLFFCFAVWVNEFIKIFKIMVAYNDKIKLSNHRSFTNEDWKKLWPFLKIKSCATLDYTTYKAFFSAYMHIFRCVLAHEIPNPAYKLNQSKPNLNKIKIIYLFWCPRV